MDDDLTPGSDDLRRDLLFRVTMHRRRFLGLAAAGAGAAVLAACSDDGGSDDAARSTTSADGAADRSTSSTRPTADTAPVEVPDAQGLTADPFTLGVSSGDPLPDSVILWTRLAPDLADRSGAAGMSAPVQVLWEVADDEAFERIVASGLETADGEFAHSIHADAGGLAPDTWYWYRFRVGPYETAPARTRTLPAPDADVDRLVFAFASCQRRQSGHWTAYDHLAADEPDLVFHLGDYIYEYPGGTGELAVSLSNEPTTLADYRIVYGDYKRDAKLQKAHSVAPWVVTWDDHEVENNYAGGAPEKAEDQAGFAARRKAAYQAFWEHHPVRIDPPAADGGLDLYRTLQVGTLATFLVLDGRQYRTDQVCGDEIPTSASECPELDDESNTMLGTEQEDWLEAGLADSTTTWTVLAQQTVMKALVLGDLVLNVDQWDGYPAARTRLLQSIEKAGVENVVVLTGDIHAAGAADIRSPGAGTVGPVVAHELVGTSISSEGIAALGALDLTPLGLPYVNATDHGYVRCTVTPERWTAEFVVVSTVAKPDATSRVDAVATIDAGRPGLKVTRPAGG